MNASYQNNTYRSRFASSMNGRLSVSERSFHSAPNLLEISELCIFGFSCAIFRRWPLDHTMNAFIGRLTWSFCKVLEVIVRKLFAHTCTELK